jgi:hypothetical protein
MTKEDFLHSQFGFLRSEILARQARVFWTVVIGLLGMPALTYLAVGRDIMIWLALPFLILVVIILFLAEQNAMMRVGRYIREYIEREVDMPMGWETWLESRGQYRLMEKSFIGSFIIIFFLYYFLSISMALYRLWVEASADPSGQYILWLYGAVFAYGLGGFWALANLIHHWRSSVSTTAQMPTQRATGVLGQDVV